MNLQTIHTYSMVTFNDVRPRLDVVFDNAINSNRAVYIRPFIRKLNNALRGRKIRAKVTPEETKPPNKHGHFYPLILGLCSPSEGGRSEAMIHIIMSICPGANRLILDNDAWENFRYRFYQTILHELVHRAQFTFRDKHDRNSLVFKVSTGASSKVRGEQKYFGEMDEIEAYARDLVEDWYYFWPTTPLSLPKLKAMFKAKDRCMSTIRHYAPLYNGDLKHPVTVRLFQKVSQWNKLITPLAGSSMSCPMYVRLALDYTTLE